MKQADNNKKSKHLAAQDRQEIMNGLDKGLSFISEELAALLDISYVAPEDVVQSPRLLNG